MHQSCDALPGGRVSPRAIPSTPRRERALRRAARSTSSRRPEPPTVQEVPTYHATVHIDPEFDTVTLKDGTLLRLRRLRRDDLDALRRAFRRLTSDEIELRFMYQSRELPAYIEQEVRELDATRNVAFVLTDPAGEIRAVADMHIAVPEGTEAEFGLIVGKAIAGNGLGRLLMERLLAEARRRRLILSGLVVRTNGRMVELCRALGAEVAVAPDDPTMLTVRFPA